MADNENVEKYTLELATVGQDTAVANVNKVNQALTITLAETRELTTASMSLAEQLASPNAAAQLGLTADELAQVNDQLGLATPQVDQVTASLNQADASAQNLIRDLGDLGNDIRAIPEPDLSAFGVDEGGDGGGGISAGGLRSGLRAGAGLLGAEAGGGALSAASRLVALGVTLGPVAVGAGLLALGLKAVGDAEQAAAEGGKKFVDSLSDIQAQIAKGATSGDLQKQIDDLQKQKTVQQETFDQLTEFHDRYLYLITHTELPDTSDQLHALETEVAAASGGTLALVNLSGAVDEAKTKLDGTTSSIGVLSVEIQTAGVKANDAASAATEIGNAIGGDLSDGFKRFNEALDNARQSKIDEIGAELAKGINLVAEAMLLGQETTKSAADAYLEELAAEGKAEDGLRAAQAKADQDAIESATRRQAILDEEKGKLQDIETADAEKRIELAQSNGDRLAQIAQQNADRVAKIELDYSRSFAQAVGDRDSLAAARAQIKHDDDLDAQAKANQAAIDQQSAAYQKQLEAQDKALTKQEAALEKSYVKQLQQFDEAARKQQAADQLAIQRKQADLEGANAALRTIDLTAQQTGESDFYQHQERMLSIQQAGNLALEVGFGSFYDKLAIGLSDVAHGVVGGIGDFFNNPLPPVQETPGGSGTPFPTSGGWGASAAGTHTFTFHITPQDSGAAVNTLLSALDGFLTSKGVRA